MVQFVANLFARLRLLRDRRKQIVQILASDSKRSFWAMADQGVVSLGNFGLGILLGLYFAQMNALKDFGAFWVVMELILFLNSLHQSLLIYPLSVRGAVLDREALGRMTSTCMVLTMLIWPILAMVVVLSALVIPVSLGVALWAALAMLLGQLQETLRRALMARSKFRSALLGDSVSYIGQIAVLLLLGYGNNLSLMTAFQAMAVTSGLAALIQAPQIGLHNVNFKELPKFARECWNMGRWIAFGNLSKLLTGPIFSWNLTYWAGKELVGVYYALTNLVRLTNPLSFAVGTLILPNASRAFHESGARAAKSVLYRFGAVGALVLVPYLGILLIAPEFALRLVYRSGADALVPFAWALRMSALNSLLVYVSIATGVFLNAVERSRSSFIAQLWCALSMPLVVLPLTALYDVTGAAVGTAICSGVLVVVHEYYIRKLSDDGPVKNHLSLDTAALSRAA